VRGIGGHTSSVSVSQCFLSINVTTRPGASGVPLWSSLHSSLAPKHYPSLVSQTYLAYMKLALKSCLKKVKLTQTYLPEAPYVAFDVSRNSLIYAFLSFIFFQANMLIRLGRTVVWWWFPYQASARYQQAALFVSEEYSPVAKQPEVIIVPEGFHLCSMICHLVLLIRFSSCSKSNVCCCEREGRISGAVRWRNQRPMASAAAKKARWR
jgi:hypothetical protein